MNINLVFKHYFCKEFPKFIFFMLHKKLPMFSTFCAQISGLLHPTFFLVILPPVATPPDSSQLDTHCPCLTAMRNKPGKRDTRSEIFDEPYSDMILKNKLRYENFKTCTTPRPLGRQASRSRNGELNVCQCVPPCDLHPRHRHLTQY